MKQLNDQLLICIFKNLDILSLRKCRLVCKNFRSLCDQIEPTEVIAADLIRKSKDFWFHTNDQIDFQNTIKIDAFKNFKLSLEQKLKHLVLSVNCEKKFDFEFLNEFTELEHFYLEFYLRNLKSNQKLELPKLSIFQIIIHPFDSDKDRRSKRLELNAPQLTTLTCLGVSFFHLDLNDPKTVKHLLIDEYGSKVESFVNLEHFQCNDILTGSSVFNVDILEILTELKKLSLNFDFFDETTYDMIIGAMCYIKKQTKTMKSIDIYINGIYFHEISFIDFKRDENLLTFQLRHYNSLSGDLSFVKRIMYHRLIRSIKRTNLLEKIRLQSLTQIYPKKLPKTKEGFPVDFFKRYFNIQAIQISRAVEDQNLFIYVIKNSKYLTELDLLDSKLDQFFYDQLPKICELTQLRIVESDLSIDLKFNFIFEIKLLAIFETNRQLSTELVVRAIQKLRNINFFKFYSKNWNVNVQREAENLYELNFYDTNDKKSHIKKMSNSSNGVAIKLNEVLEAF